MFEGKSFYSFFNRYWTSKKSDLFVKKTQTTSINREEAVQSLAVVEGTLEVGSYRYSYQHLAMAKNK